MSKKSSELCRCVSAIEYGRRLMREQYSILLQAEPGLASGEPAALHDVRVALRRLRELLRTFAGVMKGQQADELEEEVDALLKSFGPLRDLDIFIQFLQSRTVSRRMETRKGWDEFLNRQLAAQKRQRGKLGEIVRGAQYRSTMSRLEALLNSKPEAIAEHDAPLAPLARRALRKAINRVEKRSKLGRQFPSEEAHRLRIACRKARYLSEFFAEPMGAPVPSLGKRLKDLQDILGDIHDIDICSQRVRDSNAPSPRILTRQLADDRKACIKRFGNAWQRYARHGFQRRVKKALKPAG